MADAEIQSFWHWFLRGKPGSPGIRKLINRWVVLHLAVGEALAWAVAGTLQVSANSVLLPLTAILVGLSFAWGGNAQALLQTEEVEGVVSHHPQGLENYTYTFQAAILTILLTVSCWGIAGLGVFDARWPTPHHTTALHITKIVLYALISLTLRECWQVVVGAHQLLLLRHKIKEHPPRTAAD